MSTTESAVAFDGQCAFALSTGKVGVAGSTKHQLVDDGTTYYFKNGAARFLWRALPGRSDKAAAVWAREARKG